VAATLLLLGIVGAPAACDDDRPATDNSHRSSQESARPVQAPSAQGTATHCTTVGEGDESATSGGVIAGPFASKLAAPSGITKFWVAASKEPTEPEDAIIRVEAGDARASSDPALYVRAAKDIKTVISPPPDGPEHIYNGTIFVPTSKGTKLRITVTIGEATGCFVTRL
jgi:hypothetical protein